jgi:hypothetical protein
MGESNFTFSLRTLRLSGENDLSYFEKYDI